MLDKIKSSDKLTRIEYGMMVVFGSLTVGFAFAPFELRVRMLLTGVFFGLTVGLWFSHLIHVTYSAINDVRGE
jgi:hypothetical protein